MKTFKLVCIHNNNMSHNRAISIAVLFALMLLVSIGFSGSVSAVPYNISIDSTQIYATQWCVWPALTTPIDPKIACNDDGSSCLALVYDTCFIEGVRVLWSVDKFVSHIEVKYTASINFTNELAGWYQQYGNGLGYDVAYFDGHQAFYIVIKNKVYVMFTVDLDGDGSLQANVVYDSFATPDNVYGADLVIDCVSDETWAYDYYQEPCGSSFGLEFADGDATHLVAFNVHAWRYKQVPAGSYYYNSRLTMVDYDVTNTTHNGTGGVGDHYNCLSSNQENCPAWPWACPCQIERMVGYANYVNGWKYYVRTFTDYCDGDCDKNELWDNINLPQEAGVHHYFGGNVYFRNVTTNISGLIYKVPTTDFSGYGSLDLVYTEDYSINETINQSDATVGGSTSFFIWERKSSGDEPNNGIWVHRQTNYEIDVQSDVNAPVTVLLYCNDSGSDYYDSGSGDWFTLNTPCQNNNRLIFTGGKRPSTHIDWVDINDSCVTDGLQIGVKYAFTPYDHTFTVRTEGNLPILGANVTVTGEGINTTDANGQALFELQTISGSILYRNNYSTCDIRYSTDGAGITKDYIIEKSGFIDEVGILSAPTKSELGGYYVWSFDDTTDETMYESGMFLNISLQVGSGVEISPCNYEVNISGPDYIAVMLNGVPNLGSTWDEFPVEFKLNHSSSPVNVTIDLTLPNGSHIIEYEDISHDERVDHVFYLPFSIDELICNEDCDCPESVCIDKYFYDGEVNLCGINGTCEYNVSNCQLPEFCDDLIGCFNADTTTPCTRDSDCPDSCVDDDTMIWGRCGADGLCKNVTYECLFECNQTANICEEMRSCEYGDTVSIKAFIYYGGNQVNLLSGSYVCDISNVGERTCLGGGLEDNVIPKAQLDYYGLTINDVYITPVDWGYTTSADGLYYNFSDVSVYCNETCNIEYEVCGGNCDQDTGLCLETIGSLEYTVRALLPTWLQFILTSLFLWTLLSLIVGAVLTYIPAKLSPNAQPTPQFGLAGMFVMYMIGIPLRFVDPFIGLIIVLGIGLYLAKMISSSMAGG